MLARVIPTYGEYKGNADHLAICVQTQLHELFFFMSVLAGHRGDEPARHSPPIISWLPPYRWLVGRYGSLASRRNTFPTCPSRPVKRPGRSTFARLLPVNAPPVAPRC